MHAVDIHPDYFVVQVRPCVGTKLQLEAKNVLAVTGAPEANNSSGANACKYTHKCPRMLCKRIHK